MADLILEARRLQELAGLSINEDDTDAALSQGLSALKDLEEIEGVEIEEDLNESVTGLVVSGLLAAPKILEWIAIAIGKISKAFSGSDENKAADTINKVAHKWEGYYLSAIKFAVKKLGIAKSVWSVDGKVDEDKLKTTAKILYAVILALAAGNAINAVLSPSSAIIKALEGALGGIKGTEIVQIVSSIKGKI
jgi:hypothetical protein